MDYGKLRSHARGVYPTQNPSRIGEARMKQDEEHAKKISREQQEILKIGT